jgi:hypothetical protein
MTMIAMSRTEIERMSVLRDQTLFARTPAWRKLAASGVSDGEGVRQAWTAGAGVNGAAGRATAAIPPPDRCIPAANTRA